MVILDASTLILLAKSDLLRMLMEKTGVAITEGVRRESLAKPGLYDAKVIAQMISEGRIQMVEYVPAGERRQLEKDFGLGTGEAETLVVARRKGIPIGTDDGPAIKAAKILGVPFLTAIHVLTELHQKGRMDKKTALAKLDGLERLGRYNARILADARERVERGR